MTSRIILAVSVAFAVLAISLPVQAASFDCGKAGTKVEHLICDNAEISKLDEELSASYKAAVQDKTKAEPIKQAQQRWLKERNGCEDAACVKRAYEARLDSLASDSKAKKFNSVQSVSRTDDYVLDPAPREMIDWNWEDYKKPEDKDVCVLYLQNLQYFARRNEPLSCGQPIAPMLQDKIKKVEWENLDPDQYSDLFKAVIKEVRAGGKELSEEEIKWRRKEIRERSAVFRRLKFYLKGSPRVEEGSNQPLPEQEFSIVQYGNDVTNPENLDTADRCQSMRGRKVANIGDTYDSPRLFVATKDLSYFFGEILDWRGSYLQNLWLINNHIYGESFDEKGDVKLTQLRLHHPVWFEAICLYHYQQAIN